jgi:hypothetical protein
MISKLIEATNQFNWGKFLVATFSPEEWAQKARVGYEGEDGPPLLRACGWGRDVFWMLDCQTGEGAIFHKPSNPVYDLNQKHQIWVCPMYEPTLMKIAKLEWQTPLDLPDVIELTDEETRDHSALYGFRRTRKKSAKGKHRA